MPYTFGAANNDRASISLLAGQSGQNNVVLTCGWFLPTTLTAGRFLWGGTTGTLTTRGCLIDTTTNQLALRYTYSTTNSEIRTSDAGLVAGKWSFVAVLFIAVSNGNASVWRAWAGDVETPPYELTLTTVTAGVGSSVDPSVITPGNSGSNSSVVSAFQGDLAQIDRIAWGMSTAPANPFRVTAGPISDDTALQCLQWFVRPIWLGKLPLRHCVPPSQSGNANSEWEYLRWVANNGAPAYRWGQQAGGAGGSIHAAVTINGATWSQNGHPRPVRSWVVG